MLDLAEELKAAAAEGMQLPSLFVDPASILAVMVNEVVPECPEDDFYGNCLLYTSPSPRDRG